MDVNARNRCLYWLKSWRVASIWIVVLPHKPECWVPEVDHLPDFKVLELLVYPIHTYPSCEG
jgi:hypothetical protein